MSNKPPIPSWQRAQAASPPPDAPSESTSMSDAQLERAPSSSITDTSAEDSKENTTAPDHANLLKQASTFLEDATIRDAPREKKVAFLQSKGVMIEDIESLLGPSPQEDAIDLSAAGERAWGKPPPQPAAPKPQPRDIPPIVTYPEFLTQSERPPPLITTSRLLSTVYIAGGLAATMYGLSKYIIAPMAQNLTESRHDFASYTQEQLEELNKRLGEAVSVDPAKQTKSPADILDDISEADSDPTELFHRDFGTQTTPSLSRRPSVASVPEADSTMVTAHDNRLKIISSHLKELQETKSNDGASTDSLRTKISDLTTYLSEMSYQTSYYSMGSYASNYGLPKSKDGKEDHMETFKADIRAVKGVLLSARNFPAGGPRGSTATGRVGV